MKFIDATLQTPAANLACDEAWLDHCEETGEEILRVWEAPGLFVVVGYGNQVASEVNLDLCQKHGVPVLRRCSGGGTVVQGPGCLSYAVCLRAADAGELATVTGTNHFVMERNRTALAQLLGAEVSIQGHTDLAIGSHGQWLKFSGNAQRRRREAVLFHGTILYLADLPVFAALLPQPTRQPDYRVSRDHLSFLTNIHATRDQLISCLKNAWSAREPAAGLPSERIDALVRERYGIPAWNFSR